jgi:hypothetical protein
MTSKALHETIRTALHGEWWRSIHEKIEASPDEHVERLTQVVMSALEPTLAKPTVELVVKSADGAKMLDFMRAQIAAKAEPRKTVTLAFEDAQRLFDLATDSPLVCSGSFETDDVVVLRRLAATIGVDPNRATPDEFAAQYPHPFKRRHVYAEMRPAETGPEAQARIAEERADPKCQVGTYGRRCGKLIDDPIHRATEMGA